MAVHPTMIQYEAEIVALRQQLAEAKGRSGGLVVLHNLAVEAAARQKQRAELAEERVRRLEGWLQLMATHECAFRGDGDPCVDHPLLRQCVACSARALLAESEGDSPVLPQWYCPPCGIGPLGAFGHAICPSCGNPMVEWKEGDIPPC